MQSGNCDNAVMRTTTRQKRPEVGTVWVLEAGTGKLVLNLKDKGEATTVVAFSPDARTLLTAPVTSAAFSADGSRLGYAVAGPGLRVTGYGPPLRCLP